MSMSLRYKGGFYSYSNMLYDIEIWQEGFTGSASDVAFCTSPLEIEWSEVDKIEPVQASHATLQLYSDTDRQFIDLYSIKVGSIRLDVYRNGSLYWSGTLDTELYEEPFSYLDNYGVKLTFSDFAVLDRIKFDLTGFLTLRDFIVYALQKSGIKYTTIEEYISTKTYEFDTTSLLDNVSVISDNFYDEDAEPQTIRKAIEGILKPLSLHITQKAGKVYIYDLNDVYTAFKPSEIEWSSDDATLGSDKVYNNVKVTFSPYERKTLLSGEVKLKDDPNSKTITTWVNTESTDAEIGFKTHLSNNGTGLEKNAAARFFSIEPIYSGTEETGVAWTLKTLKPRQPDYTSLLNMPGKDTSAMLLKIPTLAYIANPGLTIREKFLLKMNMQMLVDTRYNPFEDVSMQNEDGDYDKLKNWCNYVYVPYLLTLRDESGAALYHWQNNSVKESKSFARIGRWVSGEGTFGEAWLCWYSGNRESETGLGGWQSNKQIIGYCHGKSLPYLFDKMSSGEYIDFPSGEGWLELQIGTGILCYDYESSTDWKLREDIYPLIKWIMYKEPTIDIVDKYYKDINSKDVELKAWLNVDAHEDLKIDTILGTLNKSSICALGQFFKTTDKSVINAFYRAGTTDRIEKLLIGTIYSNYADRHITLSGTAELLPSFGIYSDKNQAGNYLLLSETQHLQDDESEIKVAAFEVDNYTAVKYTEDE